MRRELSPFKRRKNRWQESRRAILEFNRSLSIIADRDALMASISARISELFGADRILILRGSAEEPLFHVVFCKGFSAEQTQGLTFTQKGRLSRWLLTNETVLLVKQDRDVLEYLNADERDILTRLDIRVCVPLLVLNGLSGIMLLSTTSPKWQLGGDDLTLLQMLMGQASIAFENAYLYQQQRDRLRRLYRAERLATAGQLAASIAHEVRNPLTSIRSTVQYLLSEFDDRHPKRTLVEGVISEVDRINRTVDGLLALTRNTEFKPEKVSLAPLLEQSVMMVRAQATKQSVDCRMAGAELDVQVLGDVSQLKQLFLNLLLNALQAMPGGGQIEVKLSLLFGGLGADKTWASVSIRDSGTGIAPENLEKIFDPFFTTKPKGTGLGLSTSYAIARQHGGEIEIDSEVGKGTTVTLRFPAVDY